MCKIRTSGSGIDCYTNLAFNERKQSSRGKEYRGEPPLVDIYSLNHLTKFYLMLQLLQNY